MASALSLLWIKLRYQKFLKRTSIQFLEGELIASKLMAALPQIQKWAGKWPEAQTERYVDKTLTFKTNVMYAYNFSFLLAVSNQNLPVTPI